MIHVTFRSVPLVFALALVGCGSSSKDGGDAGSPAIQPNQVLCTMEGLQ